MPIDIVYFGSPAFAVPSLEALVADDRLRVRLVVTQPDRAAGRGRRLMPPAVKLAAERLGLPVWQPVTLRDGRAVERLRELAPDLFIVVAFGEILRREVLAIPRRGCLNIHPSLLPRYRGSSPIQAAILNGDAETGVSVIEMVRRLDAGPIVAQTRVPLTGTETGGSLSDELARVSAAMLPGVTVAWADGLIAATPQEDDLATYTRELTKADGRIDWSRAAVEIERRVRAMTPWPGAWTTIDGRRLGILAADIEGETSVVEAGGLRLVNGAVLAGTGTVPLGLVTVQPEGRRAMSATDWYRGARLSDHARFGPSPDQSPL